MKKKLKKVIKEYIHDKGYEIKDIKVPACTMGVLSLDISFEEKIAPVFYIGEKPMYEGDIFYSIQKAKNWILKERKVSNLPPILNLTIRELFATKESALDYVLEEAKKRFKGCNYVKISSGEKENIINEFRIEKIVVTDYGIVDKKGIYVWCEASGWIAKPIKEQPLMLGDEIVEINKKWLGKDLTTIHCKGESVTKEDWLKWHNNLKNILSSVFGGAKIITKLSNFETIIQSDTHKGKIGCISGVTIDQIEAITKALNEM